MCVTVAAIDTTLVIRVVVSGVGLVALAIAGLFVYNGRQYRQQSAHVESARPSTAEDLKPGLSKVRGTVRLAEGAVVDVPWVEGDAVAARLTVEAYRDRVVDMFDGWKTLLEATETVSFLVEDDTGTVRVDPTDEGRIEIETETDYVSGSEMPSQEVKEYIEQVAPDEDGLVSGTDPRRYGTGTIAVGDEVVVVGEVQRGAASWDDEFVLASPPDPNSFVLTRKTVEQLTTERERAGVVLYAIGGFLGVIGVMFTVVPWFATISVG